ncbi:hypothetical protein AVEN_68313-1 [Araneus ventricosus]|uniref:Uncharacterized protein n=1 Tax=Araneus ventricosus TaxID=182803 RepID=A0A4Y2WZH7_ARAVE|nr:hypothetical protein AVEN_68313-1 [Araneus ventricosus]
MTELDINKKYPVSEIRQLSTKYGEKIIVELEDASAISLPQRCVNKASDYLKLNDIIPLYFVWNWHGTSLCVYLYSVLAYEEARAKLRTRMAEKGRQ